MSSRYRTRWSLVASLLVLLVLQACSTSDSPAPDLEPVVRVDADDGSVAPVVVRFDASASSSPGGSIVSYRWTVDGVVQDEGGPILDAYFAKAGSHTVTVTIEDADGNTGVEEVTVGIDAAVSPYTIDVRFFDDEDMTLRQRRAFSAAARRWAEVIRSDFEAIPYSRPAGECGVPESFDGTIDDILIYASIADIDGPGGILAQAGPCVLDSSDLPIYGVMQFDVEDLDVLDDNADLEGVILHEMGHVLGFGTVWSDHGLIDPPVDADESCFVDPRFVGANAVREWHEYGGTGGVPVQPGAADGTSCGHWREAPDTPDLYNELMTGYLDADMRLSTITIGSLEDIGYGVDYGAADFWTRFPSLEAGEDREPLEIRDVIWPRAEDDRHPVER